MGTIIVIPKPIFSMKFALTLLEGEGWGRLHRGIELEQSLERKPKERHSKPRVSPTR